MNGWQCAERSTVSAWNCISYLKRIATTLGLNVLNGGRGGRMSVSLEMVGDTTADMRPLDAAFTFRAFHPHAYL